MPAITVVLPTYNRSATLPRAIDSVLRQTFRDFELLVVDDASSDDTASVVRRYEDSRVRYVRLDENRGAAGARNAGVAQSTSEWIAFQDSDDEWLENRIEQQWTIATAAPERTGLIIGGYSNANRTVRAEHILAGNDPLPDLLDGSAFITPTWLIRRRALNELGGFDESYPCLEDWDLVFRLAQRYDIRAVPGPVLRKHSSGEDSVCADPKRLSSAMNQIIKAHGERWSADPARLAQRLAHVAYLQYQSGDGSSARATYRRALGLAPMNAAVLAFLAATHLGPWAMRAARRLWPSYARLAR